MALLHCVEPIFEESHGACGVQEFHFLHTSFHLFSTTDAAGFYSIPSNKKGPVAGLSSPETREAHHAEITFLEYNCANSV
jgi:hypothetical protein